MILVDLNQVMISNMMAQIGSHTNAQVDENMLRHMILNTLRSNRQKFTQEFGELLICCDDKNYWRRQAYPYYKANRRKSREKSELDWNSIFTALNNIREELKQYFPYKVMQIETCEADDIIGTIVHKEGKVLNSGEPILILSGDKDFAQLHTYANVKQYDPTRKRWISQSNPEEFLFEHILRGDASDGVPNVLSADNALVMNIRQRPVTKKRILEWTDINKMDDEVKRNYMRNKSMIDLTQIPDTIQETILISYAEENTKDRSQLLNYFIKNKLKNLMSSITEF
jgi:5'-3' exonuclease